MTQIITPPSSAVAHHLTHETGGADAIAAIAAGILTSGTVPLARISGLTDAQIAAAAGIAKSKLAALAIVNADVDAAAAIAKSKLAALNIGDADIAAGGLTNAAIAAAAGIAKSKLAALAIVPADFSSIPSARVYKAAAQSIATATLTAIAFDSERYDTDAIHDPVTNNTRLTCKTAGKYAIFGNAEFAPNVTGTRILYIRVNGLDDVAVAAYPVSHGTYGSVISVATQYQLAVNDYVEMRVYQDSGVALNVNASPKYSPEFGMSWVGP